MAMLRERRVVREPSPHRTLPLGAHSVSTTFPKLPVSARATSPTLQRGKLRLTISLVESNSVGTARRNQRPIASQALCLCGAGSGRELHGVPSPAAHSLPTPWPATRFAPPSSFQTQSLPSAPG